MHVCVAKHIASALLDVHGSTSSGLTFQHCHLLYLLVQPCKFPLLCSLHDASPSSCFSTVFANSWHTEIRALCLLVREGGQIVARNIWYGCDR
jgi:hypothetical protein